MFIFIRNIPKSTTITDLLVFLTPGTKTLFFNNQSSIEDVRIVVLRDKKLNHLEFHALVKTDKKIGKNIIKRLSGKQLNGLRVYLREYQIRSYKNDRRQLSISKYDTIHEGNRRSDRRRGSDIEEIPHIVTESYDNSRKLL